MTNAISRSPSSAKFSASLLDINQTSISSRIGWVYCFTGNHKHDNMLRDEFSFEYAPSASLCLNIIAMHTPGQECCDFLLSYCKKFEALLKPLKPGHANPEIDYAFVTRILYCLSFAAKVITIRVSNQAAIVMSFVYFCETDPRWHIKLR